jgi:multiple sugar transport system substrate-binding protein
MKTGNKDVDRTIVSRRAFLRGLVVTGGAMVVAACGGNAAPQGGASATSAPAAASGTGGQVTIEWLNRYDSNVVQELMPQIVAAFEAENPDIKVNYQNPGNGEGYTEQLLTRVAGGNPPDVATMFEPPVELAVRGALTELDGYMSGAKLATPDAFYPAPLGSCQWQGKTYGLPSSAGASAMFMNTALLAEKGISSRDAFPKTWDDLKALDKEFIVMENGELKQAGFVPFMSGSWIYPAWSAMNGSQIYDTANTRYTIDSEQNIEWIDYWLRWLDEQYGGSIEALNVAGEWGGAYSDSAFHQGLASMTCEGSWVCTDAEIPFDWEVARFPVGPSGSKSFTTFYPNWWVVPKGSKQPEAAFRFVEYLTTTGWTIWYKTIMDTPAWKNFPTDVVTERLVSGIGQERATDVNAFFAEYLNDAAQMWTSPVESFAIERFAEAVDRVLNKQQTPKEALAEAQQQAQEKLEEVLANK